MKEKTFLGSYFALLVCVGSLVYQNYSFQDRILYLESEMQNHDSQLEAQEFIIINLIEVIDAVEERQKQKSGFVQHF